ncbi:hypothetical protein HU727_006805 [Pseudomonas sp. SWRI153]|uniref:Fimbrial protein n=2 Tax=Pseudomonas khorasanensis TaxID=2745508 RepID=A0A923F1I1_9PSED|nr:hypothetical protein [Pseudomonas khorasanensis]MBV4485293.1 hypothetical protein [Pseudomonas khorasanensis]
MKKSLCWLGLLMALGASSAQTANLEIRAVFKPDPAQPNKNLFVNQTPNSGYCADLPGECAQHNMFSIRLPVRFSNSRYINPNEAVWAKAPANWRQLTVTNAETLESETVEVRIVGIGSNYELSKSAAELVGVTDILEGHQKLWTSNSWVYAPAPCLYSGVGTYSPSTYRFFWKSPVEATCNKVPTVGLHSLSFNTLDFAYELRTPNPLGMTTGLYTGALTYTLGPAQDFDMGVMMQPDDARLTLDFVLDVQHTLKVDLPPGGNKVALEPEGGWQQWINGGPKPGRIFRDQTFNISASSRFKVMMQCQNSLGGERCQMYGNGLVTDVTTRMTLPAGITFSGNPVGRYPLQHESWSGTFEPSQYVNRQVGTLHFEIPSDAIDRLLKPGIGASLSTNITIIWDSEV